MNSHNGALSDLERRNAGAQSCRRISIHLLIPLDQQRSNSAR